MGERSTLTIGQKSLLGEESRDDGLEEKERGDMGLAKGEKPPCCSTGVRKRIGKKQENKRRQCASNDYFSQKWRHQLLWAYQPSHSFPVPLTGWDDNRQRGGGGWFDDLVARSGVAFFPVPGQMLVACPAKDQVVRGPWPQRVIQRSHYVTTSCYGARGWHGGHSSSWCVAWSRGLVCGEVQ